MPETGEVEENMSQTPSRLQAFSMKFRKTGTWQDEFMPWRLLAKAFLECGKMFCVLLSVFYQFSPLSQWYSSSTNPLMTCGRGEGTDWLDYVCEGTKATVLSFPLICASVSLVMTGRYLLQLRLYYLTVLRETIIKFELNITSPTFLKLYASLVVGMLHFLLDMLRPPYLTMATATPILAVYLLQVGFFFLILVNFGDTKYHFCSAGALIEETPELAKVLSQKEQIFSDQSFKDIANQVLEEVPDEDSIDIATLIDRVNKKRELEPDVDQEEENDAPEMRGVATMVSQILLPETIADDGKATDVGLLEGLWPADIVLNKKIQDEDTTTFRHTFRVYKCVYILGNLIILIPMLIMCRFKLQEAIGMPLPPSSVVIGGTYYEIMGLGFCRDDKNYRPDGFYGMMSCESQRRTRLLSRRSSIQHDIGPYADDIQDYTDSYANYTSTDVFTEEPRAPNCLERKLGKICNSASSPGCLGFSYLFRHGHDKDGAYSALYFKGMVNALPGWTDFSQDDTGGIGIYNQSLIVSATGKENEVCLRKFDGSPRPFAYAGFALYMLHLLEMLFLFKEVAKRGLFNE